MEFDQRYTDGDYLAKNPGWSLEDAAWKAGMITDLLQQYKVKFDTVTEVGCGAGGVLHALSQRFADASFSGYDISPQAIALAQQFQQAQLQFYQEDFLSKDTQPADLLLVIDVVEQNKRQTVCFSYSAGYELPHPFEAACNAAATPGCGAYTLFYQRAGMVGTAGLRICHYRLAIHKAAD
jgi:SAM-dependent methyltransferase